MTRPDNPGRIRKALLRWPDLDDDELSRLADVHPRQQVNQICRRLAATGVLERRVGPRGKIVNRWVGPSEQGPVDTPPLPSAAPTSTAPSFGPHERSTWRGPTSLSKTLVLIPCSGAKAQGDEAAAPGRSIADVLPSDLAMQLAAARRRHADLADVDETTRMPAYRRYQGALYAAAGPSIEAAQDQGVDILILSGGYGVVLADEPIGTYDGVLTLSRWPRGLLERVLLTYAEQRGLRHVWALASATGDYQRLVARVPWQQAGIEEAWLLTPVAAAGAMLKSPRAQGEALRDLLLGRLDSTWRSSDGLALTACRLA